MPYSDPAKQSAYQSNWVAKRRAEWIETNGPCTDCGSTQDIQVDHVDASMKVSHRIWSWAKERREAELAKCVVRCQPCHAKKTMASGEHLRGNDLPQSKLTRDDVLLIRSSPLSLRKLAAQLGVDYTLVWQVRKRKIWQHI